MITHRYIYIYTHTHTHTQTSYAECTCINCMAEYMFFLIRIGEFHSNFFPVENYLHIGNWESEKYILSLQIIT